MQFSTNIVGYRREYQDVLGNYAHYAEGIIFPSGWRQGYKAEEKWLNALDEIYGKGTLEIEIFRKVFGEPLCKEGDWHVWSFTDKEPPIIHWCENTLYAMVCEDRIGWQFDHEHCNQTSNIRILCHLRAAVERTILCWEDPIIEIDDIENSR